MPKQVVHDLLRVFDTLSKLGRGRRLRRDAVTCDEPEGSSLQSLRALSLRSQKSEIRDQKSSLPAF